MRAKERISSMVLLMLIVISCCSMLHGHICHTCAESSHHTCCGCSDHVDECATHRTAVDHNCKVSHGETLEYLAPSVSDSSSQVDNELYTYILSSSQGSISYAEQAAMEIFRLRNDDIVGVLCPSSSSLRAPPAQV